MSSSTSLRAPAVWTPPSAVRVRGTLAVLAGAGEDADVYARFGARIAVDGYAVGVFAADDADAATSWLSAQEAQPRILVGSDRGAIAALAAVASGSAVDGAVVAALPVAGVDDATAEDAERTACPVHLGVLGARPGVAASEVASEVAGAAAPLELPSAAELAGIRVPVLAVHGGADAISPIGRARTALSALRTLEFVETVGGLHDALNDQSHRSVAATVVLWLERLRAHGVDSPIVVVR